MKKISLLLCITMLVACKHFDNHVKDMTETPATTEFNLDSVKAAIRASNQAFTAALSRGDSAAAAASYRKDACLMQSGMPNTCGHAAILAFFGGARKMGVGGIKISTVEITGGKELVSEEGTYELLGIDGKTIDKGKYLTTWKPENGQWKIYRDITSSEMPMPPSKK